MEVVTEDLDYNNLLNVSAINHAEVVYDLRNVPVHVCGHSSLISTPATNLDINWLPETINKADICQEAFNTVDDIKETPVELTASETIQVPKPSKKRGKTTNTKVSTKRPVEALTNIQKCRKSFSEQIDLHLNTLIPNNRSKIVVKEKELEKARGYLAGLNMVKLDLEVTQPSSLQIELCNTERNILKPKYKWNKGYQTELENFVKLQKRYLNYLQMNVDEKRKNCEEILARKTGILNRDLEFIQDTDTVQHI